MGSNNSQKKYDSEIVKFENIAWRIKKDSVTLHNLDKDIKITLNGVGADIWGYILDNDRTNIRSIVKYVCCKYEIDEIESIYLDVSVYICQLAHNYIIKNEFSPQPNFERNLVDFYTDDKNILSDRDNFELEAATFELTYKCNEKCIHCYICDDEATITLSKYLELVDELKEMQVLYLSFTGGEPLLRKEFVELYEYAHSLGFALDLYTNATLISERYIHLFSSCKPRCIYISLYSINSHVHDKITRISGSFAKTISSINSLVKNNINIILNIPIMTANYRDIIDIVKYADANKIKYKLSFNITPKNNGDNSPTALQCYDDHELKRILKQINYNSNECPEVNDFVCGAGLSSVTINPLGEVKACVGLPIKVGSIFETTIEDIWNNSPMLANIRNIKWIDCKDCYHCDMKQHCNHCMGMSYFETNDIKSRNRSDCYIARMKHEYAEK